jgi:hypothetical protein
LGKSQAAFSLFKLSAISDQPNIGEFLQVEPNAPLNGKLLAAIEQLATSIEQLTTDH